MLKANSRDETEKYGCEYHGIPGVSLSCYNAIRRLVEDEANNPIASVKQLSCGNDHAFFIHLQNGEEIIIKSGFTSGYECSGTSYLKKENVLLRNHVTYEGEISEEILYRLNTSSLTAEDMADITLTDISRSR